MPEQFQRISARRGPAGYPLAALALLITSLAVVLACADAERWREQYAWLQTGTPLRWLAIFGGAALVGGTVGIVHLFASNAGWRVRLLAPIAGVLASQLAVLVLLAPAPIWRTLFAVTVLLTTSILFRLGTE